MTLNTLPLEKIHTDLGAKLVPFGGWNMPVQYTDGIIAEHKHTRESVSIFDICHMGEFMIEGPGATEALDKILARSIHSQKIGVCRYNFLMNSLGGVRDDLIVYRLGDESYFIVVNAATTADDAYWIKQNLPETVVFTDVSANTGKLDLQGPLTFEVMSLLGFDKSELPDYFKFIQTEFKGIPCIVSRTGYTGERGLEFYVAVEDLQKLWGLLTSDPRVKPAGLGARDTLRLEVGYALYGHELNETTTPYDIGYEKLIKLTGRDFVGKHSLINAERKYLTGIVLDKRRAAREGTAVKIELENIEDIGTVTSGSFAPSVGTAVALAFLKHELPVGTEVLLGEGPKFLKGVVTELPFYKEGTVRD